MKAFRRWSGTTYRGWTLDTVRSISVMFRAEREGSARQLLITWGGGQ